MSTSLVLPAAQDSKLSSSMFANIRKEVLPNGLTIITQTNSGSPIVSMNFFVNTGSMNEDAEISGISHFCEHMFYRGTSVRSNIEMKTEIESFGGVFNAETSRDFTRFYVTVPSEFGIPVLKIHVDALMNASYDPDQVNQERKVILEEYNLTRSSPMAIMSDVIFNQAFPDHPYGRSVIGSEKTIKNITREDLLRYKSRWYTPSNILIVLVGNFDRDAYVKVIKDLFAPIPGGPPAGNTTYDSGPIQGEVKKVETKPFLVDQAFFVMGFRSPGIKDEADVLGMDLLLFMLGHGKDSFLERELSKRLNLTRSCGASFLTSKDPTLVLIHARTEPGKVDALQDAVLDLLGRIRQGDFEESDMERAKNLLTRSYLYDLETNDSKAQNIGFYHYMGGLDFARNYVDRLRNLTKADVLRVANKYFGDDYCVYVMKPGK